MVTSPRAALNTRRESHLPIYLIGRQVRQSIFFYNYFMTLNNYIDKKNIYEKSCDSLLFYLIIVQ
jgi:hypothetical protein